MKTKPAAEHGHFHGDGGLVTDPVCGMKVDPAETAHRVEVDGLAFHFCSTHCADRFTADPVAYSKPKAATAPPVAAGTIWTCPMHPQIRRDGPGTCPICGMALEPLQPSLDVGPNPELIAMTRRFWFCAALSIPLLILTMGTELAGWHPLPMAASIWVQFAIATPVVLWGAWPFFERGWASLKSRNLNMFTLISLGVGAACPFAENRSLRTIAPAPA